MNTKRCSKCSETKPVTDFHRNSRTGDGLTHQCKPCRAAVSAAWRAANPERHSKTNADWYIANPGANRRYHLAIRYGLTPEQYDAMHDAQAGLCMTCNQPETARHQSGTLRTLAVDHNHTTGKVRGLLCGKCNRAIGLLNEDPALLDSVAAYLRNHSMVAP